MNQQTVASESFEWEERWCPQVDKRARNPDPVQGESSPSSAESETIGHADGLRLGTAHDLQYLRPGKVGTSALSWTTVI